MRSPRGGRPVTPLVQVAGTQNLDPGPGWWYPKGALPGPGQPFYTFILKVESRCNLDCPYCFVYHLADQRWREQPKVMPEPVLEASIERIREHVQSHALSDIGVVFHGGEPLMVGAQLLDRMCSRIQEGVGSTRVHFGLQTNGTLLTEVLVTVLKRHKISVGISIDGPPEYHDRYRVFRSGQGSSKLVLRGVDLLRAAPEVFGGILCVVDISNDPIRTYRFLSKLGSPAIDFLLPHASHETLPPNVTDRAEIVRYGTWLSTIFNEWYDQPPRERPTIRMFESIMRLWLGQSSLVESIGPGCVDLVVVESDGGIEGVDALKSCYQGAAVTGHSVFDSSFDAALGSPVIASRQMGLNSLSPICRSCDLVRICGGGYQPHRYSRPDGFVNPSIYCDALTHFIRHIGDRMAGDAAAIGSSIGELSSAIQ